MARLFSFKGRAGRREFWIISLAIVASAGVLLWGTLHLFGKVAGPQGFWVVLLVWISLAVGVRRLHDRGKRWWWIFLFYFLPHGLMSPLEKGADRSIVVLSLWVVGVALSVWAVAELGAGPGEPGENRFGPPED